MSSPLPILRQTVRSLSRSPGLALLCILTLAVGIASVTSVFSVVKGVLLDPLPYPQPDELVLIRHVAPGLNLEGLPQSPATYLLYQDQSRTLEGVALFRRGQANLEDEGEPQRVAVGEVTPSLLTMLETPPRIGRNFSEEEGRPGAEPVVILGDRIWHRRYGGDPDVVGSTISLDGTSATVIGILPAGFELLDPAIDLWRPLTIDPATAQLGDFGPTGIARLKPGTTIEQAQADLNRLLGDLTARFPASDAAPVLAGAGFAAELTPLRDEVVGDVEGLLWILLGATGVILLIAAANVGNLLLVRSERRQRERTIQMALGASPGRVVGSVLAESLVLGVAAGVVGIALSAGALRLLLRLRPANLPRLDEIGIDGTVLLFALGVVLLTSVLAGVLPALRSRGRDLGATLRAGSGVGAGGTGRFARRARRLLVAGQVALALVLMVAAGLFLRSFFQVSSIDLGFQGKNVLTLELALPQNRYPDGQSISRLTDRILERVGALPGVTGVAITSSLPLSGSDRGLGFQVEGMELPQGAPPPVLFFNNVSPDYFKVMGVPVLEGRSLRHEDTIQPTGSVVVNRTLAQHLWPDSDPIGKRFRPVTGDPETPWSTVVGVVGDVRHRRPTDPAVPRVYYPLLTGMPLTSILQSVGVAARTAQDPASLMGAVRQQIRDLDPSLPVEGLSTMGARIGRANARMRFTVLLFVVGASVALVLGIVGLYAFIAYLVSQRTAEIGIRMTLGADGGRIRRMVLRESLLTAFGGAVVGLAGAFAVTRSLESLLYQISPADPETFLVVPILLVLLALAAALVPAARAARVDPVTAIDPDA